MSAGRDIAAVVFAVAAAASGCHVDPPLPPVATCTEVADHVYALLEPKSSHTRAIRDAMEHHCDADRWSERTRNCIAEEPALDARHGCRETLTASQRGHLDAALAALSTAMGPESTARSSLPGCPVAVAECVAVCAALDHIADCQQLPALARSAQKESCQSR